MVLQDMTVQEPITLTHWSHSQDMSFRRCRLQWYRRQVLGLKSKRKANPLIHGLTIHYALQQFHSLNPSDRSYDALLQYAQEDYGTHRQGVIETAYDPGVAAREFDSWFGQIGVPTLRKIWDVYKEDQQIPQLTMTEVSVEAALDGTDILYVARLDAVTPKFIFETKTMGKDKRGDFDFHDLQAGRNIWVLNKSGLMPIPIRTVLYNFIVFPLKSRDGILSRQWYEPSTEEIYWTIHDIPLVVQEAMRPDMVIHHDFRKSCQYECEFYQLCLERKLGNPIDDILEDQFTTRAQRELVESAKSEEDTDIAVEEDG